MKQFSLEIHPQIPDHKIVQDARVLILSVLAVMVERATDIISGGEGPERSVHIPQVAWILVLRGGLDWNYRDFSSTLWKSLDLGVDHSTLVTPLVYRMSGLG